MSQMREYRKPKPPLRAKGNLSYLQFIRLVQKIWAEAHPEVPLIPSGDDKPSTYPCIVYSLQLRKTHTNETKMRYRQEINHEEDVFLIGGQRFQNIVYFTAITESKADLVEQLIETFEDFMLEFTPVFKELGISELIYARRLSDTEDNRQGSGVIRRTISYQVTTEKVIATRHKRMEEILIRARTWLSEFDDYEESGTIFDSSPRYTLHGYNATLSYHITQDDIDSVSSFEEVLIRIPSTNFRINDVLYLLSNTKESSGKSLNGFYRVTNIIGNPYSVDVGYTLSIRDGGSHDISEIGPGKGFAYYFPETISSEIVDDEKNLST